MNRTPKLATHTLTFGVLSMAKYTTDFKLSVIAYYLNGHSYKQTAKQFNLSTETLLNSGSNSTKHTALMVFKDEAPKLSMTQTLNLTQSNKFKMANP